MKAPETRQRRNLLDKVGITPRDLILLVFILLNAYLIANGHEQLDQRLIQVDHAVSQTVRQCESVVSLP